MRKQFALLLLICSILILGFWIFKIVSSQGLNKRSMIRDFESVYEETIRNIVMLNMPGTKLNIKQVTRPFLKLYKQYKREYKTDKNKVIGAELKLAKILSIIGKVEKALTIWSKVALEKDINPKDKVEALYSLAKIRFQYLSDTENAIPIFNKIVDNYDKEYSPETAWFVLWSKLRLGEIYVMKKEFEKAESYFAEVINNQNIKEIGTNDVVFIYAFIAEKYLLLKQVQKSLKVAEEGLRICSEFSFLDFSWAFDWLVWIKMRVANWYYQQGDLEKGKQLYEELINNGFFNETSRLKNAFFYHLFYIPKPFFVDSVKTIKELEISTTILSKCFPEMKNQITVLKQFKIH